MKAQVNTFTEIRKSVIQVLDQISIPLDLTYQQQASTQDDTSKSSKSIYRKCLDNIVRILLIVVVSESIVSILYIFDFYQRLGFRSQTNVQESRQMLYPKSTEQLYQTKISIKKDLMDSVKRKDIKSIKQLVTQAKEFKIDTCLVQKAEKLIGNSKRHIDQQQNSFRVLKPVDKQFEQKSLQQSIQQTSSTQSFIDQSSENETSHNTNNIFQNQPVLSKKQGNWSNIITKRKPKQNSKQAQQQQVQPKQDKQVKQEKQGKQENKVVKQQSKDNIKNQIQTQKFNRQQGSHQRTNVQTDQNLEQNYQKLPENKKVEVESKKDFKGKIQFLWGGSSSKKINFWSSRSQGKDTKEAISQETKDINKTGQKGSARDSISSAKIKPQGKQVEVKLQREPLNQKQNKQQPQKYPNNKSWLLGTGIRFRSSSAQKQEINSSTHSANETNHSTKESSDHPQAFSPPPSPMVQPFTIPKSKSNIFSKLQSNKSSTQLQEEKQKSDKSSQQKSLEVQTLIPKANVLDDLEGIVQWSVKDILDLEQQDQQNYQVKEHSDKQNPVVSPFNSAQDITQESQSAKTSNRFGKFFGNIFDRSSSQQSIYKPALTGQDDQLDQVAKNNLQLDSKQVLDTKIDLGVNTISNNKQNSNSIEPKSPHTYQGPKLSSVSDTYTPRPGLPQITQNIQVPQEQQYLHNYNINNVRMQIGRPAFFRPPIPVQNNQLSQMQQPYQSTTLNSLDLGSDNQFLNAIPVNQYLLQQQVKQYQQYLSLQPQNQNQQQTELLNNTFPKAKLEQNLMALNALQNERQQSQSFHQQRPIPSFPNNQVLVSQLYNQKLAQQKSQNDSQNIQFPYQQYANSQNFSSGYNPNQLSSDSLKVLQVQQNQTLMQQVQQRIIEQQRQEQLDLLRQLAFIQHQNSLNMKQQEEVRFQNYQRQALNPFAQPFYSQSELASNPYINYSMSDDRTFDKIQTRKQI